MELLEFLWGVLVEAVLIFAVARLVEHGVRCDEPEDALKVSFVHAVIFRVLFRLAVIVGALPIMLLVMVPLVGPFLVVAWMGLLAFGVAGLSLFLAEKLIDGFWLEGLPTAYFVVLLVGFGRVCLALLW